MTDTFTQVNYEVLLAFTGNGLICQPIGIAYESHYISKTDYLKGEIETMDKCDKNWIYSYAG